MDTLKSCIQLIRSYTGSDIYIVGGTLRDHLMGRESNDIDLVVEKDAVSIAKRFAQENGGSFILLDKDHGTARVVFKDKQLTVDIMESKGKDIYDDLAKRDFTMNALACKISLNGTFDLDQIIDPFGGIEDIKKKQIRAISNIGFQEDPIRMMRAVRFMAEFDFDLEDHTVCLIKENSDRLQEAAVERIAYELFHLLKCSRTHYYFNIMDKYLNLLNKVFPEIEPMKDVGQCKYHVVDSWTHSLYTLNVVESIIYADGYFENHLKRAYEEHTRQILGGGHTRLQLIKLAALFHDIGKPSARWVDETGRVRFRGHEITGMEIMADISDRLKLSSKEKQFLCKMVKEHMWPLTLYKENDVSGSAVYGLFKNFGEDTLDILLISLADIIATRKLLHPHEEMGMYKVHIEYLANNYLTRFKDIADLSNILNGNDIKSRFSLKDDEQIGALLEAVRKGIFFGKIPPERERALQYIMDEILKQPE
ncbi:CCA tRNA nucleotidyltransferase [Geosporobacter ferrireducens]|uniref:Polynucleotide adenylyltransferase n=1 Tax=Geosporobacter ferrireducens TaxID=1424294 RepID=A0A1D8GHB0_9FIRM|nr:HDIG domain-containing metalloprotein [Geosporobacter ferrireducens]AOT70280.1 polynucleotide adenylyltransferase [Geosporobacter ferrireducens]